MMTENNKRSTEDIQKTTLARTAPNVALFWGRGGFRATWKHFLPKPAPCTFHRCVFRYREREFSTWQHATKLATWLSEGCSMKQAPGQRRIFPCKDAVHFHWITRWSSRCFRGCWPKSMRPTIESKDWSWQVVTFLVSAAGHILCPPVCSVAHHVYPSTKVIRSAYTQTTPLYTYVNEYIWTCPCVPKQKKIYICCEVIIWAKFGHLKGYYLGQVRVIIWAKFFGLYLKWFQAIFANSVIILCFFGAQLSANFLRIAFFKKRVHLFFISVL